MAHWSAGEIKAESIKTRFKERLNTVGINTITVAMKEGADYSGVLSIKLNNKNIVEHYNYGIIKIGILYGCCGAGILFTPNAPNVQQFPPDLMMDIAEWCLKKLKVGIVTAIVVPTSTYATYFGDLEKRGWIKTIEVSNPRYGGYGGYGSTLNHYVADVGKLKNVVKL